ncbi:hypothetical protein TGP89_240820, partial [Toxoplasma gondii p89]
GGDEKPCDSCEAEADQDAHDEEEDGDEGRQKQTALVVVSQYEEWMPVSTGSRGVPRCSFFKSQDDCESVLRNIVAADDRRDSETPPSGAGNALSGGRTVRSSVARAWHCKEAAFPGFAETRLQTEKLKSVEESQFTVLHLSTAQRGGQRETE